jgi:multidrug efflux pump subunit AcrB
MGDFMDVEITNAIASIAREDGDIQISVDGDLEEGVDTISTQQAYLAFAESYSYPPGISYKS